MPRRKSTKRATAPHPARLIIDGLATKATASMLDAGVKLLRRREAGAYERKLREAMERGFARVMSGPEPSGYAIRVHAMFRRLVKPGAGGGGAGGAPMYDAHGRVTLEYMGEGLAAQGITAGDLPFMPDPRDPAAPYIPNPSYRGASKRAD